MRSRNPSLNVVASKVAEDLYIMATLSGGWKFGKSVFRGTMIKTGSFLPFELAQNAADSFVFSFPDVYDGTV